MDETRLGPMEARFAQLIWDHAPIPSGQLVKLCQEELSWKKSTTYTMLQRLCRRGLFQNVDSVVTPLMTREEFRALQSEQFVEQAFQGSLPAFLTAFTAREKLTDQEVAALQRLIDENRG